MKSTIDVSKGNLRLRNVVKLMHRVSNEERTKLENEGYAFKDIDTHSELVCVSLPIEDGIAIEKRIEVDGKSSYIVIAYVKPNKGEAKVESVGTRLFDEVSIEEYPIIRSLTKVAFEIVEALNNND